MTLDAGRVEQIFVEAAALRAPEERAAYLDQACGNDTKLRARVDELLASHDAADNFLDLPASPVSEAPGARIGRYKLLEQIGEGGFGVVFMAEQEFPVRRKVALKLIKPGVDTRQVIARFEAERQALALMEHENIARVLDAGATESGRPYFVMELVRGVPITEYCDKHLLTPQARLELFVKVCRAVQHAHTKGVIHRDIKPTNVLVTLHDGVPVPKVIDFGVAKATGQQLTDKTLFTNFAQMVGTPLYMSPEQAEMSGLDVDTRSDIYSLGVLLYELLTGSTPFDKDRLRQAAFDEVRRIIREEEPPRPSTRLSASATLPAIAANRGLEPKKLSGLVHGELDWIVMKALEKDRGRRYETASGLARDVERYLGDEAVLACPPSARYRFGKFARRNKGALAAAAALALALMLGVIGTTWQSVRATRAQRQALANEFLAKQQQDLAEQKRTAAEYQTYVTSVLAGGTALQVNESVNLQRYLNDAPKVYRNWEWAFLKASADESMTTLGGHQEGVSSVAFSPDGTRILTGSDDKTAKLWDITTGQELVTLRGHQEGVSSVAFSPDGTRILTGSYDKTAKLWDAATGQELTTLRGHQAEVTSVAFSPDGTRILTGFTDRTAKLWDITTGQELVTLRGTAGEVTSVAFSPDGTRILTGFTDRTAKLWEAATGKELATLRGHSHFITGVAFSPDGTRMLTGSSDQTAKLWDAATGQELATLRGLNGEILSVAFSPDGTRILTGSNDQIGKLWDAATGQELATLRGHQKGVSSVAFSPDGTRILTGSWDKTAKLWDITTGKSIGTFRGHRNDVLAVAFGPDGTRILSGSADGTAMLWDVATGQELATLHGHKEWIYAVTFSPDGKLILTASDNQTAKLWDTATGKELATLRGHTDAIQSVAFSPDGKRMLTGSNDSTSTLWDVATAQKLFTLRGHTNAVRSVAFSPDGTRILTGSFDETAKLWDAVTSQELNTLRGTAAVRSVAFNSNGKRILTGFLDNTARLWDADTGKEMSTLRGHTGDVYSVAFSPDGTRILTGSSDNTARLWDAATGKEVATLRGHDGSVFSVAFSPDGTRILTGSRDKTVKLWDSVPWAIRSRERQAAMLAWSQAGPLVDPLFASLSDWSKVASAIGDRKDLTADLRRQALNLVLSRSTAGNLPVSLENLSVEEVAGLIERIHTLDAKSALQGSPGGQMRRGEFLLLGGEAERAVPLLQRALENNMGKGNDPWYYRALGWGLYSCGRRAEAQAAFEKTIDLLGHWPPKPTDLESQIVWTAAYFLDRVSEADYTNVKGWGLPSDRESRTACYPWFFVGQRREIEGKRDEAIAAYRKSVELGRVPNADRFGTFSAYRLGILTGTIKPPSSAPTTAPATRP